MNLENTSCRYFYIERLLLPFSVEGQLSPSDEPYLLFIGTNFQEEILIIVETVVLGLNTYKNILLRVRKFLRMRAFSDGFDKRGPLE